jgi:uncharacterized protein DUF3866
MLELRRGTVVEAREADGPEQRLEVEIDGDKRLAIADVGLVGEAEVGDDVVVNVQARDLGLGSGGFDIVHVNLTHGLGGHGTPGAHVMKLNYTSLQHAVLPVEGEDLRVPLGRPVAVAALHGQLAPLAWALARGAPGTALGYVQTVGGALPGGHSRAVRELRARRLLAGHLTAGAAYGGEGEAISTAGAIHHGLSELGWEARGQGSSARGRPWGMAEWRRWTRRTRRSRSAVTPCWSPGCRRATRAPAISASRTTRGRFSACCSAASPSLLRATSRRPPRPSATTGR